MEQKGEAGEKAHKGVLYITSYKSKDEIATGCKI